jgi:hypothetical protein
MHVSVARVYLTRVRNFSGLLDRYKMDILLAALLMTSPALFSAGICMLSHTGGIVLFAALLHASWNAMLHGNRGRFLSMT